MTVLFFSNVAHQGIMYTKDSQFHFSPWAMAPRPRAELSWLQDLQSLTAVWEWVASQLYWRNRSATGWTLAKQ